jgi:hypothetical protein
MVIRLAVMSLCTITDMEAVTEHNTIPIIRADYMDRNTVPTIKMDSTERNIILTFKVDSMDRRVLTGGICFARIDSVR